jgi:Protein of unknown function (DUF1203)
MSKTVENLVAHPARSGAPDVLGWIVEAIPASRLEQIRATGRDEAGNPLTAQVDYEGGSPLRCCLRESRRGDRVLLIAYTPPGTAGAYAERGPVFVHADACDGYPNVHEYPPELGHRRQVVRAYDAEGRIEGGILAKGREQLEEAVRVLLERPGVELVHLRNVEYGCYNFTIRPVSSRGEDA